MEKYFTPVCGSSEDELKHKHQRLVSHHQVQHHHPKLYQGRGLKRPSDENKRHNDINDLRHHQNHPHHHHHHHSVMSTIPQRSQYNTFSRASTSSLSSSSSSTSSPWTSEPSLDNERYLLHNKPQHSLSCSNIPEARHKFQDEESEDLDFDQSDSAVLPHRRHQHQQHFGHSDHPQQGSERGQRTSQLCRGQSRSEEGLLQNPEAEKKPHPMEPGPLYKTASLGQGLAFNESAARVVTRGMLGPKRAVSTIQLPSKGILKNKDEGQMQGNVRKSKSMEVLSTRVQVTAPRKQSTVQTVRAELLNKKLEFSAFLDEITRQVISPSRLSSFGITATTTTTKPVSPKSLHEESRIPTKKLAQECIQRPTTTQQSSKPARLEGAKLGTDSPSHSRRRSHPSKHDLNHQTVSASSPPQQRQQQHSHERRSCTTKSPTERHGSTSSHKQQHRKYSQLLTDGTSTSPEPIVQEKHHPAKHRGAYHGGRGPGKEFHTGHEHKGSPPPTRLSGLESESPSSKSSTATSLSSEKGHKNKHTGHRRSSKNSQRDPVSTEDRAEVLEQYNKELHENLLQTVACIENMEGELQCTKAELNSFKEKYKRLQESYTSCQQANSVLEQKLQSVVDSMNSERKYHLHRIMELSKQLDAAKNTIISLENINVPSLIKELLNKHFNSQEAVRNFLLSSNSPGLSDDSQSGRAFGHRDNQSPAGIEVENTSDWLLTGQKGLSDRQQHVTAFLPWSEHQDPWTGKEKTVLLNQGTEPGDVNLPFTVTDISQTIYRKRADERAAGHDPMFTVHHLGSETEIHSVGMWKASDVPANPYSLEEIGSNSAAGVQGTERSTDNAQNNTNKVTYISAQKMLDHFMSQIPSPAEEGPLERDHLGRDWARRPAEGL